MAKYAGKYETADELEKAYTELQSKLGEQGKELNQVKKGYQQIEQWAQQAAPIYDWYAKNEAEVKRRWEIAERAGQQPQQPQQQAAVQQQAQQAVNNIPGSEWFTPQERAALTNEITQQIAASTINPWVQNFTQAVEKYAANERASLQAQQRASTNVFWQTLQRVIPADKLAEAQKFHEESLRFADPSKIDPMKLAEESLALRGEASSWKQKYDEMVKQNEDRERAEVPSFGTGSFPAGASDNKPAPTSKDDRFKAVMEATRTEHGQDGINSLFGANR